jgi:hypothetical protein
VGGGYEKAREVVFTKLWGASVRSGKKKIQKKIFLAFLLSLSCHQQRTVIYLLLF